jgi:hypothetical protein
VQKPRRSPFCPYSPSRLEGAFSGVRLHNLLMEPGLGTGRSTSDQLGHR